MTPDPSYFPGQRCISTTEPELGLGKIITADRRYIEVAFPANDSFRKYAVSSAPLRRITFKPGDRITDNKGIVHTITMIDDASPGGLLIYICGNASVPESDLAETATVSTPFQRLVNGIADGCNDFELRMALLKLQSCILQSPVRGFAGGRIELLPHQLFIADEVASRRIVRVLLADETGLGKTIEACLIIHRLILTGRIERVLICVPEPLLNQWFIELLRRFNLLFRLFTPEHFDSLAKNINPFLEDQMGICSIEFLSRNAPLTDMAVAAGWDMVIVDEAHHLRGESMEYRCVQRLSEKSKGLILLSATPEQLGSRDHFLRLRLLDPHRYSDFEQYEAGAERFQRLSGVIDAQIIAKGIDPQTTMPGDILLDLPQDWKQPEDGSGSVNDCSLLRIIDRMGTGRVMFRNTRRMISGFPVRNVHLVPLDELPDSEAGNAVLSKDDPRILWLANLIADFVDDKFLVICSTKKLAVGIQEALQARMKLSIALFHEEMTLIMRDRNAAWFAEEDGARVLLCSEIGSEGRNFQFCRRLVLFDLPSDPELLEQRIGRLDRIGQGSAIHLYVPYCGNSPQEVLCRWFHEGLDAFQKNVPAAGRVYDIVGREVNELLTEAAMRKSPPAHLHERLQALIERSRHLCAEISARLLGGRDRLLEISSFQPLRAAQLIREIRHTDEQHLAAGIMRRLLKHYGIVVEDAGAGKWILLTEYVTDQRFPLPRLEKPMITYDRKTALSCETIEFVSIDHPMVSGALELFLSGDFGTSVYCIWTDPHVQELLLESLFIVECIAPASLNSNRFLPPTPVRIVVNHRGEDVTEICPEHTLRAVCVNAPVSKLLSSAKLVDGFLPRMMKASAARAEDCAHPLITEALTAMNTLLDEEIRRLQDLKKFNPAVPDEEIEDLKREKDALSTHLKASRLRLDSIRVIRRGSSAQGGWSNG